MGQGRKERRGGGSPPPEKASKHTHQMRPMKGYMMNMIGHQ